MTKQSTIPALREVNKALNEYEQQRPYVQRIVSTVERKGQAAWGELYLRRAARDLEHYYHEVKPHTDRLTELVQRNQDKIGNPPAGINVLKALVVYLESEWEGQE